MNNKFQWLTLLVSVIVILSAKTLFAQVTSNGNGSYIEVVSYKGLTVPNAITYRINVDGANINYPNWSLMVRANPTIINSEGKTIDPSKISIRLNNVTGGPTIQSIGASTTPIPLSFSNQAVFKKSKYSIKHGPKEFYSQYIFTFDIIVKEGDYLQELKSVQNYILGLTFSVLASNDELLTQASIPAGLRVLPKDAPSVPVYGIQVNAMARTGNLEFKTISDYVSGVSQSYPKGLSIISNTPYEVQVKSLGSNFVAGANTLALNTVNLELKDSEVQWSYAGGTIALSENTQTIFNAININMQARWFDIRYFTKPNDVRMLNSKAANYQTTLTYTLLPQ